MARAAAIEQVRVVTRAEAAVQRVAMRERRELAQAVTGSARQEILPLIEADRREQLGRAQAAAERRHRLPGRVGERLLSQARALRERIGVELTRVREWVIERFAEPIKQVREHTRALFGQGLEPTPEDRAALTGRLTMQRAPRPPTVGHQSERSAQPARVSPAPVIDAGKAAARERFEQWKTERAATAQRTAEQAREAALELKTRQALEGRQAVVAEQLTMARRRAVQAVGWSDRGESWQACSPTLQTLVANLAQTTQASDQRKIVERALQKPGVVERLELELSQYQKSLARIGGIRYERGGAALHDARDHRAAADQHRRRGGGAHGIARAAAGAAQSIEGCSGGERQ